MIRGLLVLTLLCGTAVLTRSAAPAGDREKPAVRVLQGIKATGFAGTLVEITTPEQFAKLFGDKAKEQVDFAKEKVLWVTWAGSSSSYLTFGVKDDKGTPTVVVVIETPSPALADYRPHGGLIAMPKEAAWEFGSFTSALQAQEEVELKRLQGTWLPHKTVKLPEFRWDIQVFKNELVISHARDGGGMMVAIDTYRTTFRLKVEGKKVRLIPDKKTDNISEVVLRVDGDSLLVEEATCGKVVLKGEWRRTSSGVAPGKPEAKKPSPARLKGMKAAVADIEAGKLKIRSLPLPDPAWYGRYVELLKKECGIDCELVTGTDDFVIDEMHGYNAVMQLEIEYRFGSDILGRLAKRAQDEHFKRSK